MQSDKCCVCCIVLDRLAKCYADQQMFTEADGLYEKLLALLKERPEENRQGIATGQACESHHCLQCMASF